MFWHPVLSTIKSYSREATLLEGLESSCYHRVQGKTCCKLWYSTGCKKQQVCCETELLYLLFLLKETEEFHTVSLTKSSKCQGFGNGGTMMQGVFCLGSFLSASQYSGIQFPHITKSKSIYGLKLSIDSLWPGFELSIFVFLFQESSGFPISSTEEQRRLHWFRMKCSRCQIPAQTYKVDDIQNRNDLLVYHRSRSIMRFQFNVIKCHHRHEILKPSLSDYN